MEGGHLDYERDRESPHDGDEAMHNTTGYPVAPKQRDNTPHVPPPVRRVARAIAAAKRNMPVNHPEIDRVYNSYINQARAAMNEVRNIYNEYGYGLPKAVAIERRTGRSPIAGE